MLFVALLALAASTVDCWQSCISRLPFDCEKPLALTSAEADALLLPGDTYELKLTCQQQVDVLSYAQDECNGSLCQLLVKGPPSEHNRGQRVSRWMPLLKIMDVRKAARVADCEPDHLVWAEVLCIGRVRLPTSTGGICFSHKELPFLSAKVAGFADEAMSSEDVFKAEELIEKIDEERGALADLQSRLLCAHQSLGQPVKPGTVEQRHRLEARRRGRRQAPASCSEGTLRDRTEHLRSMLLQRGLDEAPSSTLTDLHALWDVDTEAAAELQLMSFAACGWFGPKSRTQAAQLQSTLGRLKLAHDELNEMRRRLSAQLSLSSLADECEW